MRVAHLLRKYNPSEWGGTESAVLQMIKALAAKGVDSVVYAPELASRASQPDPFADSGFPVRRFRASMPIWGITEERRNQLIAVGGNMISFDLIRSLWRDRKVDLIHSHALGRLGAIGRVIARARGLPFVVSIHGGAYDLPTVTRKELQKPSAGGWDWGKPLGLVLGARHLIEHADAVITVNPREAAYIRQRHPDRRVVSETHGIPTDEFTQDCRPAALEAFPELNGRPFLLVLGRIDPTKNQAWVVAEMAELGRRHPGVLVVFVGACTHLEYGKSMEMHIARGGLHENVILTGGIPSGDKRLIGLLQMARALVLPSTSETFGIVILEAWAAGTPVISSRTSGALGLVADGVNGLLFDLDNPATFHAAADRVLKHPEFAERMGAAGRAKATGEFGTSVRAGRMRQLYQELIEEKNALRHTAGR